MAQSRHGSFDDFTLDVRVFAEQILFDTAEAMVNYIDSSDIIPVDTHNLKDSTGVGVYQDGAIRRFIMSRRAEVQKNIGGANVWGTDVLIGLLEAGVSRYGIGDHIVLFSAMPYAIEVDEGYFNAGFFTDVLSTELEVILHEVVKRYGAKKL